MRRKALLGLLGAALAVAIYVPASSGADALASTSGGGWISGVLGGKATFGLAAAVKQDGTFKGHVVYIDHAIDFRVKSTSITSFTPGCASTLTGDGDSNFGPVNFTITVTDGGEPSGADTFSITVTGPIVYAEAGIVDGGSIQAHGLACP
jgi:hypothetical protein